MTNYNPKPQSPPKPVAQDAPPGCHDQGFEHEFDSDSEIKNQVYSLTIDVCCRLCGRRGSFIIDESDINWWHPYPSESPPDIDDDHDQLDERFSSEECAELVRMVNGDCNKKEVSDCLKEVRARRKEYGDF